MDPRQHPQGGHLIPSSAQGSLQGSKVLQGSEFEKQSKQAYQINREIPRSKKVNHN